MTTMTQHAPDPSGSPVLIVGAGLSGLIAASTLSEQGIRSLLLDKGRGPGGRLATRRLSAAAQMARADHGAQFFTVRSADFAELVHQWRRAGIVREWCHGFTPGGDGHPRYCAEGGMNTIAKYLASTLDVETEVAVTEVRETEGGWIVSSSDGRSWEAPVVLMSAPVPQSLALIDAGSVTLNAEDRLALESISYARCLALMLVLEGPSAVPEPGGVQLRLADDPMFSFVADNHMKGISDAVTLTLHVHDEPSLAMWDRDREAVIAELTIAASKWIGDAVVGEAQLQGWKFARPVVGHDEPCLMSRGAGGSVIGFIGDAFGVAKVEGAALSGLAAAERLVR
jgi:renalase